MEEKPFAESDVIIKQGDPGDYYYVLAAGKCNIFKDGVRVLQVSVVIRLPFWQLLQLRSKDWRALQRDRCGGSCRLRYTRSRQRQSFSRMLLSLLHHLYAVGMWFY